MESATARQPNYWTSDPAHPAQYWSGETQNGTVIMLVRISSKMWMRVVAENYLLGMCVQINTFDAAATMFFQLTESPWLRAGRQYSVRVSLSVHFHREQR